MHLHEVFVARSRRFPKGYFFRRVCDCTVFDYIYSTWWRCRDCGAWRDRVPGDEA